MKLSRHQWPLVTEDIQDACLQRLTVRARFNEGLPEELATKVVEQFHNERQGGAARRSRLINQVKPWLPR
jgi:hypothetical protein